MRWFAPLFVAILAILAFSNAAPDAAVHDDRFFVPSRLQLDANSLSQMFTQDTWAVAGSLEGVYRPLLLLSIALDGARSENSLRDYHVTNIALNAAAAVLLYIFLLALLRRFAPGGKPAPTVIHVVAAAAAALAFGVHPIHTEAVDSVFNRSEILATIGILSALLVIERWEERRPALTWPLAGSIYLAALLCRESSVSLPLLAASLLYLLHAGDNWRRLARRLAPLATLIVPLAIYFMLRQSALAGPSVHGPFLDVNLDPQARLGYQVALAFETLREYLRMVLWPHPLRVSYEDFSVTALPVSLLVVALAAGVAIGARRRAPLVTLGIAFFYLALLPSTRLVASSNLNLSLGGRVLFRQGTNALVIAERAVYMPSAGIALAFAAALALLASSRLKAGGAAIVGAAICILLFPITRARNQQWQNEVALFEAETRTAPQNGDAWRLLTSAYLELRRNQDAARVCDQLQQRHLRLAQLQNNCGAAYAALQRFDDAESSYRRAIDLGLASVAHGNLGIMLAQQGRQADAEAEYAKAVESEENPALRHLRQAQLLLRFHPERLEQARAELEQALAIQPGYAPALHLLRRIETPNPKR